MSFWSMNFVLPVVMIISGYLGWLWATRNNRYAYSEADYRVWQAEQLNLKARLLEKEKQLADFTTTHLEQQEALQTLQKSLVQAETKMEINHVWQTQLETQLKDQFGAMVAEQGKSLQKQFEEDTLKRLKETQDQFKTQFNITQMKPLEELINHCMRTTKELEEKRIADKSSLKTELERLLLTTGNLSRALTFNKGRGDWGELELRRLLEDSGLQEGSSFFMQPVLINKSRPDFRICMPGERVLFVDSKALQFDPNESQESDNETLAQELRQKKAVDSLRKAIKNLSEKDYQSYLQESAGFVVLYVPREAMLSNALMHSPQLFEEAYSKRVILAGPLNLMAILKAIEHSWTMARQSEHALQIIEDTQKLTEKVGVFIERMDAIGKGLKTTVKAYEGARITLEGRAGLMSLSEKLEVQYKKNKDKLLKELTRVEFESSSDLDALAE
jgi:DNA recombination protein RmuC